MKHKKLVIVIVILIICVAAAGALYFMSAGVQVDSGQVTIGSVEKIVKETGIVQSASAVTVYAKAGGEVRGINVAEGDEVTVGTVLLTKDGGSLTQDVSGLQAQLTGLQAAYKDANDLANKNKVLYEQGALSYEAYRQSVTAATQAKAQADAIRYSMQSISEAGETGGITAPISGVITAIYVKEGELITAAQALFEIANFDDIEIIAQLIAADADLIAEGNRVHVYSEDSGFSDEEATVQKVHLTAQEVISDLGISQKRVKVEITLSNTAEIRLGNDMTVEIIAASKENVARVPKEAIFEISKKEHIYVIENGKAVLRPVEIGLKGKYYTEIVDGLKEGELVILSPSNDISDGTRVKN